MKMPMRRATLLANVAKFVAEVARGHGVPAEVADQVGAAAADELAQEWGGQIITIPTDYYFRTAKRDVRILNDLAEGMKPHEICARYNMTEIALRKLRQRKELRGSHLRQRSWLEEE